MEMQMFNWRYSEQRDTIAVVTCPHSNHRILRDFSIAAELHVNVLR